MRRAASEESRRQKLDSILALSCATNLTATDIDSEVGAQQPIIAQLRHTSREATKQLHSATQRARKLARGESLAHLYLVIALQVLMTWVLLRI